MFKKNKHLALLSISALSVIAFAVKAAPLPNAQTVVAPACLVKHLHAHHHKIAANKNLLLICLLYTSPSPRD